MADARGDLSEALDLVFTHDELAELDTAQRRLAMRRVLADAGMDAVHLPRVAALVDGFGVLDDLMRDPTVTDILVNRWDEIWVEREGSLTRTGVSFASLDELMDTIERLMGRGGGRVDAARPISDIALPGGARMHVVLPPLSSGGPVISIRKFPGVPLSLDDLLARGMFDEATAELLTTSVQQRLSIAISGRTGCGKTTLLNALLGLIPATERLVTIEETPELRPGCPHHVSLIARPSNVEGVGEVTLADLLRASLRMRPDRIVVGEVRGPEAVVALDAMSTGHPGSLVTVHARSAADVETRFVALAATGGDLSEETSRSRFRDSFDLVVHVDRDRGVRRVSEVLQI